MKSDSINIPESEGTIVSCVHTNNKKFIYTIIVEVPRDKTAYRFSSSTKIDTGSHVQIEGWFTVKIPEDEDTKFDSFDLKKYCKPYHKKGWIFVDNANLNKPIIIKDLT